MRDQLQSAFAVLLGCGMLAWLSAACSRATSPGTASSAQPAHSVSATSPVASAVVSGAPAAALLPVRDASGKVGFLDAQFKLIVSPRFDSAESASEGLIAARDGENCGFLDARGQWAIKPALAKAAPFSEGLAAVAVNQSGSLRFGFIDHGGHWVVPAQFEAANSFREGLARVRANGAEQYLDHTGKVVFITPGTASYDFHGGLTRVVRKELFGYADSHGQLVIAARFAQASDFFEGLAAVKVGAHWGFIDSKGALRIPPRFVQANDFSAGRAVVASSDHEFGFLTPDGALSGSYLAASNFQDGFAGVLVAAANRAATQGTQAGERWGFVDTHGTLVVEPKFEKFEGGFREGLVAVAEPQRDFGYVDAHGQYVIPPRFTFAQEFVNGIASVQQLSAADGRKEFGYIVSAAPSPSV